MTQPASVQIEIAGKKQEEAFPAGMHSFRVPLVEGRPIFRIIREGKPEVETTGKFVISNQITYQDLLYRGGSSLR